MLSAILGGVLGAITQVLGFFVMLLGLVTSAFLQLAVTILNATISTGFISLSYTNPSDNSFIAIGWELTRGLTNIIFVLALLAIGLGTALKMNDYQAKKALPLLIIIALLINFTPVILGVIVDASNIAMNFFLSSGFQGGNVFINQMSAAWSAWSGGFSNFWDPTQHINTYMSLLILNFFNVIAAFIFFIFAGIFLMRYVIIWLLVILSPIAFASYILPATRSMFKKWWTQFMQWTFVGVTAGFYLYLANQLMKLILIDKSDVFARQGGEGFGLLNSILPWAVIIIFLILGLQAALSSSAQGANIVTSRAKKWGTAVGGFTKRKAWDQTGRRWLSGQAQKAEGKQGLLYGLAGAKLKDAKGWKKIAATPFAAVGGYHAMRALGRKGLAVGSGEMDAQVNKEKGDLKKQYASTTLLAGAFSKDWSYQKRIAAGLRLAEEGDFSKLNEEDRDRILNDALAHSPASVKDILRADPALISRDANKKALEFLLKGKDKENYLSGAMNIDDARRKASEILMGEVIRPKDIENYDSDFFLDPKYGQERMEYAILNWGTEYWNKIATNPKFSEEVHNKFNEMADKITLDEIAKTNAAYLRFRASSPAGLARYGAMEGAKDTDEINKLVKKAKATPISWAPEEEAVIRRNAYLISQSPTAGAPTVNWGRAEADFKRLKEQISQDEKDLPEVKLPIRKKEAVEFRNIAEGRKLIPIKLNEAALRKTYGAIRSAFYGMQKTQEDIKTRAYEKEQEQNKPNPDISRIATLDRELFDLDADLKNYQNKHNDLKIQEAKIKSTLHIP